DAVFGAFVASQFAGAGAGIDGDRALAGGDPLRRQADRGIVNARDHVDLVFVDPLPGRRGGDIRLVLVIRRYELDRLAQYFAAEIVDRHLRGDDGARAFQILVDAGHVAEHADRHRIVRYFLGRRGTRERGRSDRAQRRS